MIFASSPTGPKAKSPLPASAPTGCELNRKKQLQPELKIGKLCNNSLRPQTVGLKASIHNKDDNKYSSQGKLKALQRRYAELQKYAEAQDARVMELEIERSWIGTEKACVEGLIAAATTRVCLLSDALAAMTVKKSQLENVV